MKEFITLNNPNANLDEKSRLEKIQEMWLQHKQILDRYVDGVHWVNNDNFYEQLAPATTLLEYSIQQMEKIIGEREAATSKTAPIEVIEENLIEIGYSKYKNLSEVVKKFSLDYQKENIFQKNIQDNEIQKVAISQERQNTLNEGLELALPTGSEIARMSLIVTPILLELRNINQKKIAVHLSESLHVDSSNDLNGECDFIITANSTTDFVKAPILTLVEGKKNGVSEGLAQCIAQMIGAKTFNQQEKESIKVIYGCVTTGTDWQFLKLEDKTITVDNQIYYLKELETLMGILQFIVSPHLI